MAECPNIDCQKRQDGHHTTLYGKTGMGGLVSGIQKMVSRNFLMWCAVIAVSIGGALATLTYRAYSQGQKQQKEQFEAKYCTKESYYEVNGKIIKLQSDLEHVKKTTDELKTNSNQVLKILERIEIHKKVLGHD